MVPCPAITSGSSYGCTNVSFRSRASLTECVYASSYVSPCSTTFAPRPATAATLICGVVTGMTMVALHLSFCAASATPCA